MKKYFKVLGLPTYASYEQVRNARNSLLKKYHPDFYKGDKEYAKVKSAQINEAYRIIVEYLEKEQKITRETVKTKIKGGVSQRQSQRDYAAFKKQEKQRIKEEERKRAEEERQARVQEEIERIKRIRQEEESLKAEENLKAEESLKAEEKEFQTAPKIKKENKFLNSLKKLKNNVKNKIVSSNLKIKQKKAKKNANLQADSEKEKKKKLIKNTLIEDERKKDKSRLFLDCTIYILVATLGVLIILYFTGAIS